MIQVMEREMASIPDHDRLPDFLESLPDPVARCALDGTIRFVNKAWRTFSHENGYRGPDFVGRNYFDHCQVNDSAESHHARSVLEGLRSLARGERDQFTHVYPAHGPRERRWYRLLANRVDDELILHHQALICEHSDIADEARALPDYLSAARDARIAHDVKTVLNGMMGYVQLARMDLNANNAGAATAQLDHAEQAGWRIARLLDSVMLKARSATDAGTDPGGNSHQAAIDPAQILGAIIDNLRPTAPDVTFIVENDLPTTMRLTVEPDAFDRIMTNLLSNAAKYTRENGWVRVSLCRNAGGGIRLSVHDNGIGIPARILPHIFDPYRRHRQAARRAGGNGLGLANVRELVDAHDATIVIDSEVDVGTQAIVQFPGWRSVDGGSGPSASQTQGV